MHRYKIYVLPFVLLTFLKGVKSQFTILGGTVQDTGCTDRNRIHRLPQEEWYESSTCENCFCDEGQISCQVANVTCPKAPDASCKLGPVEGCCPIWNCTEKMCQGRKPDEEWTDVQNPCKKYKCTEQGLVVTRIKCPPVPVLTGSSCFQRNEEKCCPSWYCLSCPDPQSFRRLCITYEDQCVNDTSCEYGEICCLVPGCGKECMTPCIDDSGISRAIGQVWKVPDSPNESKVCREDGIHKVVNECSNQRVDDFHMKSLDIFNLVPDAMKMLASLRVPVRDSEFFLNNYIAALSPRNAKGPPSQTSAAPPSSLAGLDVEAIRSFADQFNWTALVPLLSRNIAKEAREAFDIGNKDLRQRTNLNKEIGERNEIVPLDSPSGKHQEAFRRTDPISTEMAKLGYIMAKATSKIVDSFKLPRLATTGMSLLGESLECVTRFKEYQRPDLSPRCDNASPYRTLDGSCNNPNDRLRGAAFTKLRRSLFPDYGDGISELRRSTSGDSLPSARLVSTTVNRGPNVASSAHTILLMTYGQFLDHDLTATPIAKGYRGSTIKCCDDLRTTVEDSKRHLNASVRALKLAKSLEPSLEEGNSLNTDPINDLMREIQLTSDVLLNDSMQGVVVVPPLWKTLGVEPRPTILPRRPLNEECSPISIPVDDTFYSRYGQTCMEFVRSAPAPMCTFGPREQLNQHSAYLDGSVIYGVKQDTLNSLRAFENGYLKAQVTLDGQRLLPPSDNLNDGCNVDGMYNDKRYCFIAGDGRVNEQVLLTFFQTVWKREHNRVAQILKTLNSMWDDEKLFQEARRIVIAELQQVTYNEFLPSVLGPIVMNSLDLNVKTDGSFTTDYDTRLDASISNVFATAAFRFGHSLVADIILKINRYGVPSTEELSSLFFYPFSLYDQDTVGNLARGATSQPSGNVDTYFSKEIAGNLFKGSLPFGLDLVALNLQRGRDHGIRGYTEWRTHCRLDPINSFSDLSSVMKDDAIEGFRSIYRSVHDIDLFVGGLAERPVFGGLLGPTFTCLIADQFLRIKKGDRYWFEYKGSPAPFTKAQLTQLHKVTLARILCNNVPELEKIQSLPLEIIDSTNLLKPCYQVATYSLNPWRQRPIEFPGT
ncbi:peroxidase-like isoform X1 [Palaemon carinicauda]|uniref:peroxidase-like isoform X1 n=1 Tax=Palaemon carinicauda TaxID=392227 RepID=UPI0035B69026